jgi:uncharacterized lipoprotein YmbA
MKFVMILIAALASGCASTTLNEAQYCTLPTRDNAGNYGCMAWQFGSLTDYQRLNRRWP